MSGKGWLTREDMLKDLQEVTGVVPSDSEIDQYVVQGERPPPVRREFVDEEEIQLLFGGQSGTAHGNDRSSPDLEGITHMLQMVNQLENTEEGEPKTLFRNTATDEISISKLNPEVREFVPSGTPQKQAHAKQTTRAQRKKTNLKPIAVIEGSNRNIQKQKYPSHEVPGPTTRISESNVPRQNNSPNEVERHHADRNSNFPTQRSSQSGPSSYTDKCLADSGSINEIDKIRSKIIDSSKAVSLQKRKDRNVAMASLLKLCTASPAATNSASATTTSSQSDTQKSANPQITQEENRMNLSKTLPASPEPSAVYQDLAIKDSISKVNDWFHDTDTPKNLTPRVPARSANVIGKSKANIPLSPEAFRGCILKKKTTSNPNVTSAPSDQGVKKEVKEPVAYVPSNYASDLLLKYQSNAEKLKSQLQPKDDWGTILVRQLKEKEEKMKKKALEKQNASSSEMERDDSK